MSCIWKRKRGKTVGKPGTVEKEREIKEEKLEKGRGGKSESCTWKRRRKEMKERRKEIKGGRKLGIVEKERINEEELKNREEEEK